MFDGAFTLTKRDAEPENEISKFCKQSNIEVIAAPVNDHRAIGLVERFFQTIKRGL